MDIDRYMARPYLLASAAGGAAAAAAVVTLLEREVHVRVDAASIARSCASLSARWRIWCLGGCTFGLCFTPASASYADLYCASGCGPLPPVWYWPGRPWRSGRRGRPPRAAAC